MVNTSKVVMNHKVISSISGSGKGVSLPNLTREVLGSVQKGQVQTNLEMAKLLTFFGRNPRVFPADSEPTP